ncbi:MAG: type III-B CRISPR module RAMP protein Cmr4 [Thermaurantimonas sp.]|uniref:type III-B CRISPR module RAMP protein Cmr4 n=1 Tax=Thermaurantimonas sp. TaxID=2681568 RepID=UPI00391A6517
MFKNAKPLFLICETPLHVGSGSDLGIVDLPIQRERHTNFPKIEASSLKGALREAFESELVISKTDDDKAKRNLIKINTTFGFDDAELGINVKNRFSAKDYLKEIFKDNSQFSGCISISDARLLLFPVKSLYGVFAWITCPRVIKKFIADLELAGMKSDVPEINVAKVSIGQKSTIVNGNKIYLEEFVFQNPDKKQEIDKLGEWLATNVFVGLDKYWQEKIKTDIVVLDDDDFRDFVTLATEVITRTKINNETGTVQQGALFSEEYLPAESILYSLVMFADEFSAKEDKMTAEGVLDFFNNGLPSIVQIGGNATLGKGIVRTKLLT